ncbi:MAG: pyridoxamine 5'-phosphate oxidase family protein [Deltaproteobacteria bacterium]|nr:pyridoxamine 5'-phosphate oxidase family protein [Deltaproteobacteria bacterium]
MHAPQLTVTREKRVLDQELLRRLETILKNERSGVLATCGRDRPLTNIMAFACTADLKTIVLATPRETTKYRNMAENPWVSLLIGGSKSGREPDFSAPVLTFAARAVEVKDGQERIELGRLFVDRHPELAEFIALASTALMRLDVESIRLVERFQAVTEIVLEAP